MPRLSETLKSNHERIFHLWNLGKTAEAMEQLEFHKSQVNLHIAEQLAAIREALEALANLSPTASGGTDQPLPKPKPGRPRK